MIFFATTTAVFIITTIIFGSLFINEYDDHKATKAAAQMIVRALEENEVKLEIVESEKNETD